MGAMYRRDHFGLRHCLPGVPSPPRLCDYHPDHYWCETCEGFYGVPHDGMHSGPSRHPLRAAYSCVCRVCKKASLAQQEGQT